MSITGLPGQGPVRVGIPVADLTAGIFLAQGILVALYERERSGKGQWVHTSLLQAMVTMLDFQAARWLIDGEIAPQAGNDHPTGIPTGVFTTSDGHINIAASGQTMYRRLCTAIGAPELIDDPRFKTLGDRSKNRKQMNAEIDRVLVKKTSAEWIEALNAAGVPSGPILNIKEVFENEQVKHLGLAQSVRHRARGEMKVQAPPSTLSRTPGAIRRAAPEHGEHTDEILKELGYSAEDIASLRKDAAVDYVGGPDMAPHTPHASRSGGAVALRGCAITARLTLRAPAEPWRSAGVQSPRDSRFALRRSRGAPRVCNHRETHASRSGGAVALRGCAITARPRFALRRSVALRGCAITARLTLRAPAEPWRSAGVQSPRDSRFALRRSRGAPRVCNHRETHASRSGGAVVLRGCAITARPTLRAAAETAYS